MKCGKQICKRRKKLNGDLRGLIKIEGGVGGCRVAK